MVSINSFTTQDGWLTVRELADLTGSPARTIKYRCQQKFYGEHQRIVTTRGGEQYRIHINSPLIPKEIQLAFWGEKIPAAQTAAIAADPEVESDILASLTQWERDYVMRFQVLYQLTEGMRGTELKKFLQAYDSNAWSYQNFMRIKQRYEESGKSIAAIRPKWGKSNGQSIVNDEWFERFKGEYLTERKAGVVGCWKQVLGYARIRDPQINLSEFPSHMAFLRRLKKEVPESVIYLKRYGQAAWNRKYGYSISRDYSDIMAGEVWCADHMQSDIACITPDDRVHFAWVTAWIDVKSQKWLGWSVHIDPPNSDHIFEAFFRAASIYGIPRDVIIDNGKDFRARDLSGGRKVIKASVNDNQCRSLFSSLNITVHFAWPYNAQSKIIERTFSKVNTYCSRHMQGYRGPNIANRPETLESEIKSRSIFKAIEFEKFFNDFVTLIYNKESCDGKVLQGKSPDGLWEAEYPESLKSQRIRLVTKEALRMFCSRISNVVTIRKAAIHDSVLDIDYTAPWVSLKQGSKVYLRRDLNNYAEAWAFDSSNNEYLGMVYLKSTPSAIARNEIQKQQLEQEIKNKRFVERTTRRLAKTIVTSNDDYLQNRTAAIEAINGTETKPVADGTKAAAQYIATEMDRVIAEEKRRRDQGSFDYSELDNGLESNDKRGDDVDPWNTEAVKIA